MASNSSPDYARDTLPPEIVEKLEAGAFRQLCHHLQERSDQVQNMDLMSLSGFCRNCLAKWMVLEARQLVDDKKDPTNNTQYALDSATVRALNAMGYEEAAQHVYGMTYGDWKARHQKKATEEQMEKYKASSSLHAKHNKELLATRIPVEEVKETNTTFAPSATAATSSTPSQSTLASNVCCQEVEEVAACTKEDSATTAKHSRTLPPYQPAPLPSRTLTLQVGILTVSDRASKGEYKTGDLSGPAVQQAIQDVLQSNKSDIKATISEIAIVPDDISSIQGQLEKWCDDATTTTAGAMDLVLTTGGTGLSPRDVTPQATRAILDVECAGLMQFVLAECSKVQPLASLSRGTAGIRHATLIANLPGNPKGVTEIMPLLLPLLLHAHGHVVGGNGTK